MLKVALFAMFLYYLITNDGIVPMLVAGGIVGVSMRFGKKP